MSTQHQPEVSPVGLEVEVEVGAVAHGGHCVARHEGRVLFVRHALPGERVVARVTEGAPRDSYWRADAVQVLSPSPDRVTPPCPWAGPGRCGGCDWQHATVSAQRALKAAVLTEQLERLAGLDAAALVPVVGEGGLVVEAVDGDGVDVEAGLRWRTRVQYAVGPGGRLGLREHRSHRVVEIDDCRIAAPRAAEVDPQAVTWPGAEGVEVVAPQTGDDRLLVVTPRRTGEGRRLRLPTPPAPSSLAVVGEEGLARVRGRTWVAQEVQLPRGPRSFRVTGSGFWQVHPGAAAALAGAVVASAGLEPGEHVADLYSGAGLLTAALADEVGADGTVVSVEGDARAVADARRNLRDLPQVRVLPGRVDRALAAMAADGERVDVVVLDPPRVGARRAVLERVVALAPRTVVHVACDPAALARDVAVLAELGYRLDGLRAFDLFPQTHHVEAVARLVRTG
ncbi:tRNA/tmRNA/rRNA uracil-C5-methylase, TrmA/RlmC/RlmD family [Quadrisphaera granulorum]|uniref:tRNA/tmRNA/rRNA uracil-C5-methylase (TrmA/RlmC/RlmD family) n=1 Tax=Quadrisphaera granulorum TaxID=317664 RepID=A0A315ZVQ3_9ACTN|nr:class I SAM-dependent RNA methyltransferase [Quadrisphaera granulorum]PWJ49293.1 tRNA/tmRNA/rRNA uracil-C5-methylase (TrmA/RlmC/RlmD family) [Quadrisphaera granulorum]SZE98210.1 tRNA/tmRNA/rRNA uracil-C5-methylase, TrmA/RlmC/RlmD family [Quadrisphaera granulorum]